MGGEIFCTRPDRPCGTPSLLYNGHWVFPGVKWLGCGVDHPPLLVPRLGKSRAIPLLPLWDFVACFRVNFTFSFMYTRVNKNPLAWNFLSPKPEVTCGTVAIVIRVVLLSPYLRIRAVSLSSIHYNQSHRVYINRRRQYICLIWN